MRIGFLKALAFSIFVILNSCSSGGNSGNNKGGDNQSKPGSLRVLFEFNIENVKTICLADPDCRQRYGWNADTLGEVFIQVLIQGGVDRSSTPNICYGYEQIDAGLVNYDKIHFQDLPQGGYIVTVKRNHTLGDLFLEPLRSNVRNIWFNLGFDPSFSVPVSVVDNSVSTVLIKSTAVKLNSQNSLRMPNWEYIYEISDSDGVHTISIGQDGIPREVMKDQNK